jgi:hypothetical protein
MLARVAEHGHAQIVVHPQQQVGEHPPGKNVRGYTLDLDLLVRATDSRIRFRIRN